MGGLWEFQDGIEHTVRIWIYESPHVLLHLLLSLTTLSFLLPFHFHAIFLLTQLSQPHTHCILSHENLNRKVLFILIGFCTHANIYSK